jgi:poly(3-hydroxybutyrate) depolymerase
MLNPITLACAVRRRSAKEPFMDTRSMTPSVRLGRSAKVAVLCLAGAALGACSDNDPDSPADEQIAPSMPGAESPSGVGGTESGTAPMPGASAGCGKTRTLQDGSQALMSGGVNRTFFLSTPSGYDSSVPHRVIFMFHWNYGSINSIVNPPDADRNTDRPFYGMGDLSDGKTIFIVPQGLLSPTGGAGWENPNDRDVIFTDDLLAAVSSDLCVDTTRVFTTGFSYGAAMSYKLACARPDKFRGAAVYAAGPVSGNDPAECTTPIPFFQVHGVDDPIINIATGLSVLDVFTRLNGCTAMTPPEPPQDGHTCTSYEGCQVPTRFCSFGAGENNPYNPSLRGHYPSAKVPGETTSWIPAEAWSFITQF